MKTRNDCREWRELLGAYALGHLEGDERVGLEAHLDVPCRFSGGLAHAVEHRTGGADDDPGRAGLELG